MKTQLYTRHAVLHNTQEQFPNTALVWVGGGQVGRQLHWKMCAEPFYNLVTLAEMAYNLHISHVWVLPEYGEFPRWENYDNWTFHYQERRGKVASVSIWQRGHSRPVNVIFPQHTSWYGSEKAPGWLRDELPHNILITLHYLEEALGVPIGGSPGRAGWNYLKKLNPEWVEMLPAVDWKAMHFTAAAATDIIWHRPLKQHESESPVVLYLHKFDKAAAYPYAASQTQFGKGIPRHVEGVEAERAAEHTAGHPQEIGVWRVSAEYNLENVLDFPPRTGKYGQSVWVAGPIIRMWWKFGQTVHIHEGWVFPERHGMLKKWAEELWQARRSFEYGDGWINEECAYKAARAVKTIMNTTIGMTAFKHFEDDDEMRRPDIRLQTIARHRELTMHNIDNMWTHYQRTPVLVYMDALYYLSDKPNGRVAFPGLVRREGQFGGYRWEGAIKVDWQVLDLLQSTTNEAATLEALNKIGWSMDLCQEQEGM